MQILIHSLALLYHLQLPLVTSVQRLHIWSLSLQDHGPGPGHRLHSFPKCYLTTREQILELLLVKTFYAEQDCSRGLHLLGVMELDSGAYACVYANAYVLGILRSHQKSEVPQR